MVEGKRGRPTNHSSVVVVVLLLMLSKTNTVVFLEN